MPPRSLLRTVKFAAAALDTIRPPRPGLVVLTYHRVGAGTGVEVDLPAELFAAQLDYLASHAEIATLDAGLRRVAEAGAPTIPLVCVTFDDGTADFAEIAFPILADRGVPVTLYLATDFIERQRPFPHDGRPLSWDVLRDTCSTGLVEVGSHTHSHALLDRLPAAATAAELDQSIGLIRERLGREARHFAYPKGVQGSSGAEQEVRARFASAALGGGGPNQFGRADPYRLCRSPVQVADGLRWFRHRVRGGLALEDAVRRMVNRGRYAGVTT